MNRKKLLISLAMAMLSMAGLAADNLPALRVQGKNLVDANGKTVVLAWCDGYAEPLLQWLEMARVET